MPTYGYLCSCGAHMEDFALMSDMKETMSCTKCGKDAHRHFGKNSVGVFSEKEKRSRAMAVHPSQIPAAMKKWPGSTYCPKTGHLIMKGRTEQKKRLKERGYVNYDDYA